ncbi:MAG: hypothetical protein JSW67_07620 [Candidatus Latescibacterota bacterium]|nr:MAG: hypothetical protein JSW67_07620 [Candidatus Latescibacterota bacterium]
MGSYRASSTTATLGCFLLIVLSGTRAAPAQVGAFAELQPAATSWSFRPTVALAYDTFGQSYTISEVDTLDLVDEASARLVATLLHRGRTHFEVRNALGLGQEATRNDLFVNLRRQLGALDLRIINDLHYKAYRPRSDFQLSSDYITNSARVIAALSLSPAWRLRLEDRFETARFASRTRYNYDYTRNDVGAEIEKRWGIFSSMRLGYTYGGRSVPDSLAIGYQRQRVHVGLTQGFGSHLLVVEQMFERRTYRIPTVRSHFFDTAGRLSASLSLSEKVRLRPEYRAVVTLYDRPDSVYSSANEHVTELILERDLSARATLGVGPRAEFRRTQSSFDRPYDQFGIHGMISYIAGSDFWVEFSNELGVRSHLGAGDRFLTDFVYNWTTLYLSYRFASALTFDLFFSLTPENHSDSRYDTTTILASTALTWALR